MLLPDGTDEESVPLEDFSHLQGLPADVIEQLAHETTSPDLPPEDLIVPVEPEITPGDATPGGTDDSALPDAFDPKHRTAFEGLLYLGSLSCEFPVAGHKFKIRTLTVGELLEVAQIQEKYLNNMGSSRAFVTAMVAGCLVLVDGKSLPQPITRDASDTQLANAFQYVRDSWYPWMVDKVYEKYLVLEGRVNEILEAMGGASPSVL